MVNIWTEFMLFREGIQTTLLIHGDELRFSFGFSLDLCYNCCRSNRVPSSVG